MPFASVFRGLGAIYLGLAGLAFAAGLIAVGLSEQAAVASLMGTAGFAFFLGVAGFLLARSMRGASGPREGVATLLVAWFTAPALAAFPFLEMPGLQGYGDAFFEAMAALTTTGPGLLNLEAAPRSIILWRALLEWGGGFLSIVLVLVILVALNLTGPGVHRSTLFTLDEGSLMGRFSMITRAAGLVYLLATLAAFLVLAASGSTLFDSLCLALSAPATGAGVPRSDPIQDYVAPLGQLALAGVMLAGALNFALMWQAYRDPTMRAELWRDPETRAMFGGAALIVAALLLVGLLRGRMDIAAAIHDAVSLVSTSGRFMDEEAVRRLPAVMILVVTFIGGSAVSTAGGVKIIRMLLLFNHAWVELKRVSHPSGIALLRFRGRALTERAFISLWVYFLGFTGALGALILSVALTGVDFAVAAPAAVAALSNAGPVLGVATVDDIGFGDLNGGARWFLAFGMAAGRMEVLAVMAAFIPGLWRR